MTTHKHFYVNPLFPREYIPVRVITIAEYERDYGGEVGTPSLDVCVTATATAATEARNCPQCGQALKFPIPKKGLGCGCGASMGEIERFLSTQPRNCQDSDFLVPPEASVTIVKDGDAQCRYCGILADEEEQRHLTTCRFFRDSKGG